MPPDIVHLALQYVRKGHSTGWPLARTLTGVPCDPRDSDAAQWSVQGALMRAASDLDLQGMLPSVREAIVDILFVDGYSLVWAELNPNFTHLHAEKALNKAYMQYITR
jgi:hypothetical protein